IAAIASERDAAQRSADKFAGESESCGAEMTARIERANELQIRKDQCLENIEFTRAERAARTAELEKEEEATREERTRLRAVEERARQTEIKVNRLDVELDGLLRKLSEEYEMSYELAKERFSPPEDVPAAQNEVR